ncbi:MAG: S8 family serine peptidase, partial [Planctomycetes bacterium]|nr:S8 family serine peptidase [Planctomycetota bacterium]
MTPQRCSLSAEKSARRCTVLAGLALIMLAAISGNIQAGEPATDSDRIAVQNGVRSRNNSSKANRTPTRPPGRRDYIEDEVLVLISADTDPDGKTNSAANLQNVEKSVRGTVKRRISLTQKSRNVKNHTKDQRPKPKRELLVVKLPKGKSVKDAMAERWDAKDSRILSVQPNYYVQTLQVPNDPRFSEMWALNNTGQTGGLAGADIDAVSTWNTTTGSSSVIVAVIDSGVDYTHPDLSENIWVNTAEIAGNGIDDDGNGYVDDIYGYDFEGNDSDPQDELGHGTHCAGTIAAKGNNAIGVTGVSWRSQVMVCRFIGADNYGLISDAIEAVNYAVANGANILSNSWGWQGGPSDALEAAIVNARDNGVLFVAAAGNETANNDNTSFYPANYQVSNVISVAAIDHNGELAWFSNYGSQSVHLAAPGVSILSTVPGNSYAWYSGTSMATPHVSGVAALLMVHYPQISMAELRSRIIETGTPAASLQGKTTSGRYLSAYNALTTGPDTRVIAPNGGEQWHQDRSHTINWSSIGGGATVDVYLLRNGSVYSQLADDISNEGIFVWQVPDNIPTGSDYSIRVDDGITTDESDAAFAFVEAPDNLTEMFQGQSDIFDLSNKSVLFKPDNNSSGYTGHARDITALPTDP